MIESSFDGPEMYNYQVETDEFVAQDKELCGAYEQLQKVNYLFILKFFFKLINRKSFFF